MIISKALRVCVFAALCLFSPRIFSQSIENTGKLNIQRAWHQSQLLADGRVLAFGGANMVYRTPIAYASAELYNPATQTWTMTGSMSHARVYFASVVLPNGNVMAIGGGMDPNDGEFTGQTSCEIYDVQIGQWKAAASMKVARYKPSAVRLRNGTVLVVGGSDDTRCELYDPVTDTWTFTGSLNVARGGAFGPSAVLMSGGAVLVTGGTSSAASRSGEFYSPWSGAFTALSEFSILTGERGDHSSLALPDGNVLLVGSGHATSRGTTWSEVFDVRSQTFNRRAYNTVRIGMSSPTVLLEDGKALVYTVGNYTTNTQCFQVYSPGNNIQSPSWSPLMNTTSVGVNAYTIHKLANGTILIVGGYNNIDLGATTDCLLVREPGVTDCNTIKTDLELSDNTFCYGLDGKVTVSQSESGVKYQAYIGDQAAGTAVNGGGNIDLVIPADFLASGVNRINVKATKSGCVSKMLRDVAIITTQQADIAKPVITNLKPLEFCPRGNTVLQAPAGFPKYKWSTLQTTQEITVLYAGNYTLQVFDAAGCASPSSDAVQVSVLSSDVYAGDPQTVCPDAEAFTLTGYSPTGGEWSGPGVTVTGVFDPAIAGVGRHTLRYRLCDRIVDKVVTVSPIPVVTPFTFTWRGRQTICEKEETKLDVRITEGYAYYQLRINGVDVGKPIHGTETEYGWVEFRIQDVATTSLITVVGTKTSDCGTIATLEKSDTLYVVPNAKPRVVAALRDSICVEEKAYIRVEQSEPTVRYFISGFGESVMGNGEEIQLHPGIIYTSGIYTVRGANALGCASTTVGQARLTIKPMSVDFVPGLPGDFVNDTIRFTTTSNAQTYAWTFTPAASVASSTKKDPGFITYSTPGEKTIKLVATSSIGCVDSVTRVMEIGDKPSAGHYEPCYEEEVISRADVHDFHLDKNSNTYVAGHWNSDDLHASYDMFFAKIDSTGKKAWSKEMLQGWSETSYATGIATDHDGNVYVVGHATGYEFELGKLHYVVGHRIHAGVPYMFIVKLNKDGEEQWLITATSTAEGYTDNWVVASDIAIDANDRIYVVGHRELRTAEIRFPDGTIKELTSSYGEKECFLLEIDPAGSMQDYVEFGGGQARSLGGSNGTFWYASLNGWHNVSSSSLSSATCVAINPKIKIDHDGDVLVGGVFEAAETIYPFEFGPLKVYAVRGSDPASFQSFNQRGSTFVAEYNKAQGWKSAVRGVSLGVDYLQDFAKDTDGNVYTIGGLDAQAIIHGDTIKLDNSNYRERPRYCYLAKTNASGYMEWSAINRSAYLLDVAVSKQGTIFVAGEIKNFGALYDGRNQPFGVVSGGGHNGFLGEYTPDGTLLWAKPSGKVGTDVPFAMETDACDNLYICSEGTAVRYADFVTTVSKLSPFGNCAATSCSNELTLLSFDPQAGTEGDVVHITGSNFRYVTSVTFNGVEASFAVASDGLITATVPATATTGKITLSTHNDAVTSDDVFTIDALQLIDFAPRHGLVGDQVTVYVRNIDKVRSVTFNGVETTTFTVVNDTTLHVTVPKGATTGLIGVAGNDESVTSTDVFTVDVITGNEGELTRSCVLYPNPTSGLVTLECHTMRGMYAVEVFNMLGVRVWQQTMQGSTSGNVLDLKNLSAGIYHVVIFNDNQRREYTLVKE